MPMTSVCPGCAHEEACGHAEVHACANRVPARWCSCDPLRRAEAERDRYRDKALEAECRRLFPVCSKRCSSYEATAPEWCYGVLREVDGE